MCWLLTKGNPAIGLYTATKKHISRIAERPAARRELAVVELLFRNAISSVLAVGFLSLYVFEI